MSDLGDLGEMGELSVAHCFAAALLDHGAYLGILKPQHGNAQKLRLLWMSSCCCLMFSVFIVCRINSW